ncbi:MAG: hypothetical protein ACI9K2_001392 [Myxococcota bacterium]
MALLRDGLCPETAGSTCLDIKGSFPASLDGVYWIDPSGGDTSDAFQVECDMSTDGGGWIVLTTQKPEGYFDLSYSVDNNANKFGYDGYTVESDATYVHDSFTTDDGCPFVVDLVYASDSVELDGEQLEDLRGRLTELNEGTRLVAGDCDSDGNEPGWEAYAIAADGTEVQLTTGTAGNAVWVMDVYADVGDLAIDYLLPAQFRLSDDRPGCDNGGAALAGWGSGRILVR